MSNDQTAKVQALERRARQLVRENQQLAQDNEQLSERIEHLRRTMQQILEGGHSNHGMRPH